MVSRFFTEILPSLLRLRATSIPSCKPDPEQQILAELATAAEQAMVATRSQDHTPRSPPKLVKSPAVAEDTPSGKVSRVSQKRRFVPEVLVDGGHQNTKRRRSNAASEQPDPHTISSSKSAQRRTVLQQSNGNKQSTVPIAPPTDAPGLPNDGIEVRVVINKRLSKTASPEDEKAVQANSSPESDAQDSSTRNGRGNKEAPLRDVKAPSALFRPSGLQTSHSPNKARHKKFDDEEPLITSLPTPPDAARDDAKQMVQSEKEDEAESDDEAPETITASKGLDQARHATEEANKAMKRQKAEEKRKRRERDLRLKVQAKAAKRDLGQSPVDNTPELETPISPDTLLGSFSTLGPQDQSSTKQPEKDRLPLLLPDELLNAEIVVRPRTPPPHVSQVRLDVSRKRKLLDIVSKPPKDVQRGGLKIRVLSTDGGHLPPKPSKEGKMLRESWLTGQRGPRGGFQRRKIGGGFVRAR